MSSILSVTMAAADTTLLTIGQLRAAVGVSGKSEDISLRDLGNRVAAAISKACNIRGSAAVPPTLRSEVLSETFRLTQHQDTLLLARRPVTAIASVTEAGAALAQTDYELDAAAGKLYRLSGDVRRPWTYARRGELKIVIAYTAGWPAVPDDLALAASRLVKHYYDLSGQEANVQLEISDGFGRTGYFHGPNDQTLLPADVDDLLGPYKNLSF